VRNTGFLLLGFGLLVIQSNLFWIFSRIPIAGATPNLLLPLVVFMGVHEYAIGRGAALAFILGYFLDCFASAPVGLFTFISTATFVVTHFAGVRLAAQTWATKMGLAFVFGLVEGVLVVVLTAIFGGDTTRSRSLALLVAPHAVSTALFAPFVFRLCEWIHQATVTAPAGGAR
jgi:cell shape-determining protein MreD